MSENMKSAVALGIFDGVHQGHRTVIKKAAEKSENGFIPAVFTFDSATISAKQGRKLEYIYTDEFKKKLICGIGIKEVFSADFSELKNLSGEDFVKNILIDKMNIGYAVCGKDFRFGKNASCGSEELEYFGRKYGFEVETAEDVLYCGENISSSRIRTLLKDGNAKTAGKLLETGYILNGKVVKGNQIGRTIDFPTINQLYEKEQLVPRYGVYKTLTHIDGNFFPSVTNIGIKPTIAGERSPLSETHILNYSGSLYDKTLEVHFIDFIRPEMKFNSLNELKKQISEDIKRAET